MKPFTELSQRGQVGRQRRLARRALEAWGVRDVELRLIDHHENTTFRLDITRRRGACAAGRYLLRLHRVGYQDADTVRSELEWIEALRRDLDLPLATPMPTRDGRLVAPTCVEGAPGPAAVSLLRWVPGRLAGLRMKQRSSMRALGSLIATLHEHGERWRRRRTFTRRRLDWDGLVGDAAGNGPAELAWRAIPAAVRRPLRSCARRIRADLATVGDGPDAFGLVHGDLHGGNVVVQGGRLVPIDFDDCGLGWRANDFGPALQQWGQHDVAPLADALREGYATVRPLPPGRIATFLALRNLALALWVAGRSRESEVFRNGLPKWAPAFLERIRRAGY